MLTMKRIAKIGLPATGLLALGALTSSLLGVGTAGAAPAPKPAAAAGSVSLFANVDSAGDLGSHVGATSAGFNGNSDTYAVTFNRPVVHCAASAQAGRAGGTDPASAAPSVVFEAANTSSNNELFIQFV